jgi:hypothetical protein
VPGPNEPFYAMRWFGKSWGSMANLINPRVAPPVGRPCNSCGVAITAEDTGAITGAPENEGVWHWDCFVAETKKP